MQVHPTYPPRPSHSFLRRNRQDILRSLFLFSGYTCLIINLLTGGGPWSLIVIGGLCVFWIAFLYRPLVEHTLIKKLSDISIVVCLYLFLLDSILQEGWSVYVVPIVFFSDLIFIGGIFLLFFQKQKRNFMPLFELIVSGLVASLLGILGFAHISWALIVVGGVSLVLVVLSFAIFPKEILLEMKKKMHT